MFPMNCPMCAQVLILSSWADFEAIVEAKNMPCCKIKFSSKIQRKFEEHIKRENENEH